MIEEQGVVIAIEQPFVGITKMPIKHQVISSMDSHRAVTAPSFDYSCFFASDGNTHICTHAEHVQASNANPHILLIIRTNEQYHLSL